MSTQEYQLPLEAIPYGLHVPYNRGYDARSRARAARADQQGSSGYLQRPDGAQVAMWITDITADFSISGLSAQSRMLREFFPRSFNDVTLKITGNVSNTQQYNRLAAFVREHHWKALQAINQGSAATQTLTFVLNNTYNGRSWSQPKRSVKGPHRPWVVNGYVKTIAAGAVHWEVAPEFTLEFVVAESTLNGNTGIWGDSADNGGSQLKSMLQLLAISNGSSRVQGAGFVKDPILPAPSATPSSAAQTVTQVVTSVGQDVNWSVQAVVNSL